MVLTAAGRVLKKRADELADLVALTQEELAFCGEHSGVLRAGASTSIAQYVLPKMLGCFKREHPRVKLQIGSAETRRRWWTSFWREKLQSVSSKARRCRKMFTLSLFWRTNWYCSIPRIIYGKVKELFEQWSGC